MPRRAAGREGSAARGRDGRGAGPFGGAPSGGRGAEARPRGRRAVGAGSGYPAGLEPARVGPTPRRCLPAARAHRPGPGAWRGAPPRSAVTPPAPPPPRGLVRRAATGAWALVRLGALFGCAFLATFLAMAWPRWASIRDQTLEMARQHTHHEVAHPGWSFPGRVWSAPAELSLPKERLVLQARARGYREACPAARPGEVCSKTGQVVPRGGVFAEGVQPPGLDGWSRPPALEPVFIGTLIGPDAELREHLPLEEAPKALISALLAAEDTDYYDHFGVNPVGVLRATWVNASGQGLQQGASTITMQVVRNLTQDKERTWQRKLREMLAAVALDRGLGKDAVLQMYLDAPYLGQFGSFSVCGFQAASQFYYGIDAKDLSLSQAATLASILPAPARFAPDRFPERARERRDRTLMRMAELGWDKAEIQAALADPVVAEPHGLPEDGFPSFLQATRQYLDTALPPEVVVGAGLDVFTAMDVYVQQISDETIPKELRYLERLIGRAGREPLEAAGAVVSPETGLLVAAYGGTQGLATDFNRATQARRQAGSSMKPVVYAMALSTRKPDGSRAWSAHSTIPNMKRVFPNTDGWSPRNISGDYSATSTLAMGLAWSQNVAAASLLEANGGPAAFKTFAAKLGYDTSAWRDELGLSLGSGEVTPLEQARFAATIVADGRLAPARPVVSAIDARGAVRVSPVYERPQVMAPDDAALTRGLMRLVITYGTGGASRGAGGKAGYAGPSIGKTGTTDSEKDLWFMGGSADYGMALWLGYDQPKRIGASASDLAAPLWGWWANAVHKGLPQREFDGVKTTGRAICTQTGKYGNASCRLIGAPFLDGEKPQGTCGIEHPPPPPEVEGEEGHGHEGLWKRMKRQQEEAAAAAAGGAAPAPAAPAP